MLLCLGVRNCQENSYFVIRQFYLSNWIWPVTPKRYITRLAGLPYFVSKKALDRFIIAAQVQVRTVEPGSSDKTVAYRAPNVGKSVAYPSNKASTRFGPTARITDIGEPLRARSSQMRTAIDICSRNAKKVAYDA
jgi:hypothetical protein